MAQKENQKITTGEESMAIFVAGQIMGLTGMLNVDALDRFINSARAQPSGNPDDFRYLRECKELIKFHKALFPKR
jgi:hypothetical protein